MIRLAALVVALAVVLAAGTAAADPHKLLVLQSEGRADPATRAKIDAAIVKLAATDAQASAGELNFSDAATAVGCKPEAATCKDEVLGMLAVDEIVITTLTPKPGGLEINVRRVAKGGASRDATMLLATGAPPEALDGIAPLFGGKLDTPAPDALPIPAPSAAVHEPEPSPIVTAPPEPTAPSSNRRRFEIAGMAGGGGLVILGLVMWAAASGVQDDIDKAPTTTKQNLSDLEDLESRGDTYAALGNVFALTGLAVGGVATYFFLRDRRAGATTTARLVPTVLDHGAGLVLTIGGAP